MPQQSISAAAQTVVLALVSAAFCSIYLTQPNLPTLQLYFDTDLPTVSATVSVLILGLALANIPFGMAADRLPIKPLIAVGGFTLCLSILWCARAQSIEELTTARFISGLCIPALTTCMVAWLSQTQPANRLPMVMGNYVAATVLGGFGGRIIGGVIFPPDMWRWSFVLVAVLIGLSTLAALWVLPKGPDSSNRVGSNGSLLALLKKPELLMLYACGGAGLGLFATVFNYLPYRLASPPFELSSSAATGFYGTYLIGIVAAPLAGQFSGRWGSGKTLLGGVSLLALGLCGLYINQLLLTLLALLVLSAGYFTMHSAAVGTLNSKLAKGQGRGRANSLYILFYYIGGSIGIQVGGHVYQWGGWQALVSFCLMLLIIPLCTATLEVRRSRGA